MAAFRQEIELDAAPDRVYAALATSDAHTAFTGAPAEISSEEGGPWSAYGGGVHGRHIELVPGVRIVQSWRAANWPAGTHSLVRFELQAHGTGTTLVLDHMGTPDGSDVHLTSGWHERYWEPLAKWLGN